MVVSFVKGVEEISPFDANDTLSFVELGSIATLQFNCHVALLVCFIVGVYGFVSRKHGVSQKSMQYKSFGAKMQHFDLDQTRFTLDSEEDEDDHWTT